MTGMTARPRRTVKASDLTTAEAAALAGVKPRTWSAYVARGQVDKWLANRPGQGKRS